MSRVEGPSEDRQGEIPVGVEVQPGKNTGSLKVFDGGVANFPATHDGTAGGFTTISIGGGSYTSGEARTLDELVSLARGGTKRVHLKWKRSITLYAASTNDATIRVGDRYTDGSASPNIENPASFFSKEDEVRNFALRDVSLLDEVHICPAFKQPGEGGAQAVNVLRDDPNWLAARFGRI